MPILTSKHYGVTIKVQLSAFPQCCGAKIIHEFNVAGSVAKLTVEQKEKMYADIMRKGIPEISGVLISADCVLNYGEWADLRRSSGGGNTNDARTEIAGDISLEDFCEHFNMVRGPVARNKNSGNLVASFSMAVHAAKEDGTYSSLEVPEPDFSDEPKVEKSAANGDIAAVISAIEAIISES